MKKPPPRQYRTRQDLERILQLDEAFWTATSAPARDFRCDPKFLEHLTHGRPSVTAEDVKGAIHFMLDALETPRRQSPEAAAALSFRELNPRSGLGASLLETIRFICGELALEYAPDGSISLDQVRHYIAEIKKRPLNGDGIISAQSIRTEPRLADTPLLADVVAVTGGQADNDGTVGMTLAQTQEFFRLIPGYLEWTRQGTPGGQAGGEALLPFGARTAEAHRIYLESRDKIEHFFTRCELLAFNACFPERRRDPEAPRPEVDLDHQDELRKYLGSLPLAPANRDVVLPGDPREINPFYRESWLRFHREVLVPLCGDRKGYTLEDWRRVKAAFQPYEGYLGRNPAPPLDAVPADHLELYRSRPGLQEAIAELVEKDLAVARILDKAFELEKLILCRISLFDFIDDFVFFDRLYDAARKALFEQGDVQIDARWFHLVLPVENLAAHSGMAQHSQLFVMYLEAQMPDGKKRILAAPVTNGSQNHLILNKRGVFRDLHGDEHTVRIVKIIPNPINLREALLAPVTRFMQQAEQKIEKWSSQKEKAFQNTLNAPAPPAAAAPPPPPAPAKTARPPQAAASHSSMLLSASVAVAALGSAFAFISKTVAEMSLLSILLAVLCGFAALAVPLSILAVLKLSRQNLSFLLEGNGWAINPTMKLSLRDRKSFTTFGRRSPQPGHAQTRPAPGTK